jgi:putative transposase
MTNMSELARELGVSRRSLYYHPKQEQNDWHTKQLIEEALRVHPGYGHKRLAIYLHINKKRVLRVMRKYGIKPHRRRTKKYEKRPKNAVFPNLLLTETPQKPGDIWASDFTHIVKHQGKWLYLATIIDLYTREIVGWSILTNHTTQLVLNAWCHAIHTHAPPRIIHSDQGSEYTSADYTTCVQQTGTLLSMSAPGCPWENGFQESFYGKLKTEFGDPSRYELLGELVAALHEAMYYYNSERIHTALAMSPRQFARTCVV